jgi:hypothetical protein
VSELFFKPKAQAVSLKTIHNGFSGTYIIRGVAACKFGTVAVIVSFVEVVSPLWPETLSFADTSELSLCVPAVACTGSSAVATEILVFCADDDEVFAVSSSTLLRLSNKFIPYATQSEYRQSLMSKY